MTLTLDVMRHMIGHSRGFGNSGLCRARKRQVTRLLASLTYVDFCTGLQLIPLSWGPPPASSSSGSSGMPAMRLVRPITLMLASSSTSAIFTYEHAVRPFQGAGDRVLQIPSSRCPWADMLLPPSGRRSDESRHQRSCRNGRRRVFREAALIAKWPCLIPGRRNSVPSRDGHRRLGRSLALAGSCKGI